MTSRNIKILFVCILLLNTFVLRAQHYFTEFGQNRLQYKEFNWVFYSTSHFDIYYYEGGGDYARQALDFLEVEYGKLTDVLGYAPYTKTKIFIYNSIHDLQQSNIGIDGAVFTIGGQTDFVKLQLEIAHPGNAYKFKEELILKLSRVLIEDMLFGGSLAEIFQSSYLLSLPRWFIDGAARYLAFGWSADMDDFIRDYLSNNKVKKLIKIDGGQAGLVGQSVWNYIALKYGKSNISNILNLTRIIRNEENSIASALGINYKIFLGDWQKYYTANNSEISTSFETSDKEKIFVNSRNPENHFQSVRINPDGRRIAYTENILGKYSVLVKNTESGRTTTVYSAGMRTKGQQVDYDLPLIDWLDSDVLGVVYYKRGDLILSTFNLETGEKFEKPLRQFNQVKSFSFNENGRLVLISGDVDGTNDIFLVSMRRNALRRITNDDYDDIDPVFVPGTSSIIFASNRLSDSLKVKKGEIDELSDNFNLFLYDLDTTKTKLVRITNTVSKDVKPFPLNPYEIYYISDQKGIANLFKYQFTDSTFVQITKFDKSIKDYDIQINQEGMSYMMLDNGATKIYYDKEINLDQSSFSPQTPRQRLKQARLVANIYNQRQLKDLLIESEKKTTEPLKIEIQDTIKRDVKPGEIDIENYVFGDILEEKTKSDEFIDTDNFRFEDAEPQDENSLDRFRPESFFSNYQRLEIANKVYGPVSYSPLFSFNNLITSFAIDPLRGFGMVLETKITDMLGNHKFNGGALAVTSLNQGDLFAQYEYLKGMIDYKVRLDRKSYFFETNDEARMRQRYNLTSIKTTAALPLTNRFRIELSPFFTMTEFRNLQFQNIVNQPGGEFAADSRKYFGGLGGRAVFDNTIERGYNIIQGTRGSLDVNYHQSLNDNDQSFGNIRFDFRHYQKVHKQITLASRVFYGRFFGPNPQNYMAGGLPNWLLNTRQSHPGVNPLTFNNNYDNSSILFSEFVTNLRGYDYNEMFGASSLLFNTEMRFPVFQYLSKAPLSSTFLRNFIAIAFFDVGSAWTGPIPITAENAANVIRYRKNSFYADISNFRNPWLASYGYGIRTVLLGYYIKIDYANPIRDAERLRGRLTVGIGLDF